MRHRRISIRTCVAAALGGGLFLAGPPGPVERPLPPPWKSGPVGAALGEVPASPRAQAALHEVPASTRAPAALPAPFGPGILGDGGGRSSPGDSRATGAGAPEGAVSGSRSDGLVATAVSPAIASRAAAARSGLLSSGRRAPPSAANEGGSTRDARAPIR